MRYAIQLTPGTRPGRDLSTTLRLERGSAGLREVEIPITSCDGSPGAGATVTLGGQTVIADATGIARFTIAPGRYTLTVSGLGIPAVPGTPAELFLSDTLTDTAGTDIVTLHTGEVGATWSARTSSNQAVEANHIGADGGSWVPIQALTDQSGIMFASGTPPGADYYVNVEFKVEAAAANLYKILYVFLRGTGKTLYGGGAHDFFYALLDSYNWGDSAMNSGRWKGPSGERVYNEVSPDLTTGVHNFRVEVEGYTLRLKLDGVLYHTNSALTTLSAAGIVGVGIGSGGALGALSDFRITEVEAGALSGTPEIPAGGCADYSETITIPAA